MVAMTRFLATLVGCTVATITPTHSPLAAADFAAPEFTVDLDIPPQDRWTGVLDHLLEARGYEYTWKPLHDFLERVLSRRMWLLTAPLWDLVLASYPADQRGEVIALHNWFQSKGLDWTLGQCVMVQLFYEVEDGCTSIVSQHTNGSIFHARNLDYGLPGLQNFTATITFHQKGEPVYRGTMYIGYFGILTGQRLTSNGKGSWAVSLNQRYEDVPYVRTVLSLLAGAQNVGFRLRAALATKSTYSVAVDTLRHQFFSAPCYLVVSGTAVDEGAVITRDRVGVAKAPEDRGFWSLNAANGTWYRLETNYDNWTPTPEKDQRREAAMGSMDALGQQYADVDGLFSVLDKSPVLRRPGTTYTTVMLNEAGIFNTTVRSEVPELAHVMLEAMAEKVSNGLNDLLAWYKLQSFYRDSTDAQVVV